MTCQNKNWTQETWNKSMIAIRKNIEKNFVTLREKNENENKEKTRKTQKRNYRKNLRKKPRKI